MRVVLDTNILIAGLRSNVGASFSVLQRVSERRIRPLVTTALFPEYEAVLKWDEHAAVHGLTMMQIDGLMAEFAALAEAVDVHFRWRPQLGDPQDELVLQWAGGCIGNAQCPGFRNCRGTLWSPHREASRFAGRT